MFLQCPLVVDIGEDRNVEERSFLDVVSAGRSVCELFVHPDIASRVVVSS